MPLTATEEASFRTQFDALISQFVTQSQTGSPAPTVPATLGSYTVVSQEMLADGFDHRWPDRTVATKYRPTEQVPTARYVVRTADGDYSLLIGPELNGRKTHGRDDRGRIVVFVQRGTGLTGLYPLVEFAETDEPDAQGGPLYAAGVQRPDSPRSLATAAQLDQLEGVEHLQGADIRRADEVYANMRSGPSLRLVVHVDDVEAMLKHALWVGGIRGGGRLPKPA